MTSKVIDRDHGYAAFVKEFSQAKGRRAEVGIFAGKNNSEGKAIAEYATYNEFGATITSMAARMWLRNTINKIGISNYSKTPTKPIHIPERSFLRSTFAEEQKNAIKVMKAYFQKLPLSELVKGNVLDKCLKVAAQYLVDKIKLKISDSKSWAKPNSLITIALKSKRSGIKDQPLMSTGAMRNAIVYRITQ